MANEPQQSFFLGNYRVEQTLGQGTFGKVKLAIHIPTQQHVAIKILQKQKIVEQSDIERVTRQICILKILRHPNIIQLYQIVETANAIHLVMQYAPKGELFDQIVKNKRLKQTQSVIYMQQILAGVQYIHRNGVVHRDLKPQNLLLDEDNNIKIVDFGLSNQYRPGDRLKTACGSPCYAAPEMIAGKKYECLGVDLWSCGIILYAMLCGFLPFEDPNTAKLYKKIIAGQYDTPKLLSQGSLGMLKGLLDVNPATRATLQQLRSSQWLKQTGSVYSAKGLIVGRDSIVAQEAVVAEMGKQNIDQAQVRSYVANNRHNHVTAHYYLLKKKMDKIRKNKQASAPFIPDLNLSQSFRGNKQQAREDRKNINQSTEYKPSQSRFDYLKPTAQLDSSKYHAKTENSRQQIHVQSSRHHTNMDSSKHSVAQPQSKSTSRYKQSVRTQRRQTQSPLIYRPGIKKPQSRVSTKQTIKSPNNDQSLNASTIINSLVQANKSKIIQQRMAPKKIILSTQDNFNYNQFKNFPPKRKISIVQDINPSITSRNSQEPRDSFLGKQTGTPRREPSNDTYLREQSSNKRREELQRQIRKITLKIDQQISSLKQQNNNISSNLYSMSPKYSHLNSSGHQQRMQTQIPSKDIPSIRKIVQRGQIDARKGISQTEPLYKAHNTTLNNQHLMTVPTPDTSDHAMNASSVTFNSGSRQKTIFQQSSMPQSIRAKGQPRVYNGPLNANCLFANTPQQLSMRIKNYLNARKVLFKQLQAYNFWLSEQSWVSVQSFQGIPGYSVAVFTGSTVLPLHEQLINYLNYKY